MEDKNEKKQNRMKRSESFLGIHFDFHAGDDNNEIGAHTTPEMIEQIIDAVKPDYVQCDCKGHPGYSSYPTKVGNPAPGIQKDALPIWRKVTADRGVSLYMHYSGVLDGQAISHHGTWACVDAKGKRSKMVTSTFGPYADKLLIPQFKELSDVYGVDGVWIDGECWGTTPDYGKKVIEQFQKETGIQDVPKKPDDPHYFEYVEFCREAFRKYMRHVVDTMHAYNPDFQVASNWAFTSFMPEPVSADVDFISGDYSPCNSVNSARFEARCMAGQGKPWDLMAWSFNARYGEADQCTKSVAQLKQEAAVVLSLGGGFQAYFTQKRDGSIRGWQMKLMAEVAKFCRQRQQVCHRMKPVPQIALLYSGTDYYRRNDHLFGASDIQAPMRGIMQSLLDSQYSVEITMEHQITGKMSGYPLIVNPEWQSFKPEIKKQLLDYVRQGGSLLVIGSKAVEGFEAELGVTLKGGLQEKTVVWLEHDGWLGGIKTSFRKVQTKAGTRAVGKLYYDNDVTGPYETAATVADYGKGKIAGVYFDYGERYLHGSTATARNFLNALVRELFPDPVVRVEGSHFVDVSVGTKDGRLEVNLVNTAGQHNDANTFVYDEIPAVGPLTVTVSTGKKPQRVTLEPEGVPVDYTYCEGKVHLTLPKLEIHEAITIE